MKQYSGRGLTPLFYSEISSSYMLYDLFTTNEIVISRLIEDQFKIYPETIRIQRERAYAKRGSVDLLVEFINDSKRYGVLIEVKVHDYISATEGQIATYYNAAIEENTYDTVYFIYLTQFTEEDDFTNITPPKTINEATQGKKLIGDRFTHIAWRNLHQFLSNYYNQMTDEQQLIVMLNKQWILEQCQIDLDANKIDIGERGLEDYFSDLKIDIKNTLSFGKVIFENKREIWRIDLTNLNEEQLNKVFEVIKVYSQSEVINKIKQFKTEEITIQSAKELLKQLVDDNKVWWLLAFYSELFAFVEETNFLKFNGRGGRGFSIKLEVKDKGQISLCTLNRNKTIDFYIKR